MSDGTLQGSIEFRALERDDLKKLMEIDRTEVSENDFVWRDGKLVLNKAHWGIPDWAQRTCIIARVQPGREPAFEWVKGWDVPFVGLENRSGTA